MRCSISRLCILKEVINASDKNSNMTFLRSEFSENFIKLIPTFIDVKFLPSPLIRPFPSNPSGHWHSKPPTVLTHSADFEQGAFFALHSFLRLITYNLKWRPSILLLRTC